jgi:hypothetical protein
MRHDRSSGRLRVTAAVLVTALLGAGCDEESFAPGAWPAPDCQTIMGPPTLAFTRDFGRSLVVAQASVGSAPFEYTSSIAAARNLSGTVWAAHMIGAGSDNQPGFWQSRDSGCTWRQVAASTLAFSARLVATPHSDVVGGYTTGGVLAVFTVTEDGSVASLPVEHRVIALTVASAAPLRWRWVDTAGDRWEARGTDLRDLRQLPGLAPSQTVVAAAFDPQSADALVIGDTHGAWRTRDGGIDWEPVQVDGADAADLSVHALASVNSGEFWSLGRSIVGGDPVDRYYHSSDGGASFRAVLEEGPARAFTLPTPQPNRRGVLFWIDPVSAGGLAALHRLEVETGQETSEPLTTPLDAVALALPPDGSDLVFMGLSQPVDEDPFAAARGQ